MIKQIRLLTKLELCNLFGLNVIRNTRDPEYKKKVKIFAVIMGLILAMALSYIVALCAGLAVLGAANVIPAYLIAIASFFVVFFDIFKISGVIFPKKGYDIVSSLPLSDGAVVVGRFLRMYAESLIVTGMVFVPGFTVYAVFERPQLTFYVLAVFVTIIVPLLPLAVSVFVGSFIAGVSSRMKHKSMAEAVFSLVLVIGVMGLGVSLSDVENEFSLEMLKEFSTLAMSALEKAYPPAVRIGNAVVGGKIGECFIFAAVSILTVALVMWIVKINFHTICRNLYAVKAKHDYTIAHMKTSSVRKTLIVREARRYFASGPYVSNTIIGPALGAVMAAALLVPESEKIMSQITVQMPVAMNPKEVLPFLIAAVMSMMNAVSISVSMEGKEWWIVKSLPLSAKDILEGKLFFNLLLIAPFYAVAEICLLIALKPDIWEAVWIILIPLLLITFSCVFGLRFNLLFPKLDWENETIAVKQSAASFLGGIGGVVVALLLALPVILLPVAYYHVICLAESAILVWSIRFLYKKNIRMDLERI